MGHHIGSKIDIGYLITNVKIVYKRLNTGKVEKIEVMNRIGYWFQQIRSFSTGCLACSLHDLAAGSSLHNLQDVNHSLCVVLVSSPDPQLRVY